MRYAFRLILLTSCFQLVSTFAMANDPVQEFSITKNPNGVWSYGFTQTLGGPFEVYTVGTPNAPDAPSGDIWNVGGVTCDNSCVSRSQLQEVNFKGVDVVFPFDTLHMHPGSAGQYAVVRWTAPLAGRYEFRGSFQGSQRAGPTTDVHVQWNSTRTLAQGDIDGFGAVVLFDVRQRVARGDTIDFVVGFGSDGSYYADSTALQLSIDLVPAVRISPRDPSEGIHNAKGSVAVAILSDSSFRAPAMVDRDSLTFGRIGDEQSLLRKSDHWEARTACSTIDVNGDGRKDLVCLFDRELAGFQLTDNHGVLRGKTFTGLTFKGTVPIHIVE